MKDKRINIQIGDLNKISFIAYNNASEIDVNKLIQENKQLAADLEWAMQQLHIKDILLKHFCDDT